MFWRGLCRVLLLIGFLTGASEPAEGAAPLELWQGGEVSFAGYQWRIKQGYYSPGDNYWSPANVRVDENGWLHLKISWRNGRWYCAEIASVEDFGYGEYRFRLIGRPDLLDPQVVAGLFLYPAPEEEPRENQEIDIEFARWGIPTQMAGNYTVTPFSYDFSLTLQGEYSLHSFSWIPSQVEFASYHGHDGAKPANRMAHWVYRQKQGQPVPAPPLKVHLNFWLYRGEGLETQMDQELIIRDFWYKPWTGSERKNP